MTLTPEADLNRAVLRQIVLFQDLPPDALDQLLASFSLAQFPKGVRVLQQSAPSSHALYLIRSGGVRVLTRDPEHRQERMLAVLGRGEVFGETDVLAGDEATASVETILDSELWVLPRAEFHRALTRSAQMAVRFALHLAQRLADTSRRAFLRRSHRLLGVAAGTSPAQAAFLSVNLAASVALQTRRPVVLLDLEGTTGLLPRLLGHTPRTDPEAFLADHAYLKTEAVDAARHPTPWGFDVLGFAPTADRRTFELAPALPRLLSYLRSAHGHVVVHAGAGLDPVTWKGLEQCESVLVLPGGDWSGKAAGHAGPAPTPVCLDLAQPDPAVELSVPVRDSVLARFTSDGWPLSRAYPDSAEDRGLGRLARHARAARLGLALGSGTALGWSHVGILQVLERERIPVDIIAGSSMGACIGALAAMGMSAADMTDLARSVDRETVRNLFDYNLPFPRDGLIRGQHIEAFLRNVYGDTEFRDLVLPLRVVATDIITGRRAVLRDGLVRTALRASSSIPGILRLAEVDGRPLVDGAVFESVPAQTLRDEGVQRILAVNCAQCPDMSAKWADRTARDFNIFEALMRSTEIALFQRNRASEVRGDITLNPSIAGVTWNELWRGPELIECGQRAADAALPELRRLVSED